LSLTSIHFSGYPPYKKETIVRRIPRFPLFPPFFSLNILLFYRDSVPQTPSQAERLFKGKFCDLSEALPIPSLPLNYLFFTKLCVSIIDDFLLLKFPPPEERGMGRIRGSPGEGRLLEEELVSGAPRRAPPFFPFRPCG